MSSSDEFVNSILDLDKTKAIELTKVRLNASEDPLKILEDLKTVTKKWEKNLREENSLLLI